MIVIGKGFGLVFVVKDFVQQVDVGGGIFCWGDFIVDKQYWNVQGVEFVDDVVFYQCWSGVQLGDYQIWLMGDDVFKIDVFFIVEVYVKDCG